MTKEERQEALREKKYNKQQEINEKAAAADKLKNIVNTATNKIQQTVESAGGTVNYGSGGSSSSGGGMTDTEKDRHSYSRDGYYTDETQAAAGKLRRIAQDVTEPYRGIEQTSYTNTKQYEQEQKRKKYGVEFGGSGYQTTAAKNFGKLQEKTFTNAEKEEALRALVGLEAKDATARKNAEEKLIFNKQNFGDNSQENAPLVKKAKEIYAERGEEIEAEKQRAKTAAENAKNDNEADAVDSTFKAYNKWTNAIKDVYENKYDKLPTGREDLKGVDWTDEKAASKAITGKNFEHDTIFVVDGVAFTYDEVAEHYGVEVARALMRKMDGLDDTGSAQQTGPKATDTFGIAAANGHNVYSHLGDNVIDLTDKILTGAFSSEEERKSTYDQYHNALDIYAEAVVKSGDVNALHGVMFETYKRISEIEKQETNVAVGTQGRADTAAAAKELSDRKDKLDFLENQYNELQQIRTNTETAYLVDKASRNADSGWFEMLYDLRSERRIGNTANLFNTIGNEMSDGLTNVMMETPSDLDIDGITELLHQKGYTDHDIDLYMNYNASLEAQETVKQYVKWINDNGDLGKAAAWVGEVGSSIIRGVARIGDYIADNGNGDPNKLKIYTDTIKAGMSYATEAIKQAEQEKHPGKTGEIMGNALAFLYETSASSVESTVINLATGGASIGFMMLTAGVDTYDAMLERGMDAGNAMVVGTMAGIFEWLFEKLSLENIKWFKEAKLSGKIGWAELFLKSGLTEGSEEIATDIANATFDYFYAGNFSELAQAKYNGMTATEFGLKKVQEILLSGLSGALMGSVTTTGMAATSIATDKYTQSSRNEAAGKDVSTAGDVQALIDEGKQSANKDIVKLAENVEQRAAEGKDVTKQSGELYNALQDKEVGDAVEARAKELGLNDRDAKNTAKGVTAAFNGTTVTDPAAASALEGDVAQRIIREMNGADTTGWTAEAGQKYYDRSVTGGIAQDFEAKGRRNDSRIAQGRTAINEAVRDDKSYALIENGFKGHYGGENGSSVTVGGIVGKNGGGQIVVAVDYDAKTGTKAELPLAPDGGAETVSIDDANVGELYDAAGMLMNGQEIPGTFGTAYKTDGDVPMSVNAANTMIYAYNGAVNRDVAGYAAWFYNAYKAGARGMSWDGYMDMTGAEGDAARGRYLSLTQLQEAYRAGQMEFSPQTGVTRIGMKKLTASQRARLTVWDAVLRDQGIAAIVVDSDGEKNGYISDRADVVVVSLESDAGLFEVAGFHEIVHLIKRELGADKGKKFVDDVIAEMIDDRGWEAYAEAFEQRQKKYADALERMTPAERKAYIDEEIAAQYMATIAADHMESLVKRLDKETGLLQKVWEGLKRFLAGIKDALQKLAGYDVTAREALEADETHVERLLELLQNAMEETREERENRLARQGETLRAQAETGAEFGERSAEKNSYKGASASGNIAEQSLYSRKMDTKMMDAAYKANEKYGGLVDEALLDQAKKDRAEMKALLDAAENGESGRKILLPEDIAGKGYVTDSSYGISFEPTTVCYRTLVFDRLSEMIAKQIGRPLTIEESLAVSQNMGILTDELQCLYCYVAADRIAYANAINEFIDARDALMQDVRDGKIQSAEEYENRYVALKDGREASGQTAKMARYYFEAAKSGRRLIQKSDMTDLNNNDARLREIKKRLGSGLTTEFDFIRRYAQSATWAKKRVDYRAYNGSVLNWTKDTVDKLNNQFGMRFYSFSDFSAAFVLDNMQEVTDGAVRGLKGLAYTKSTDFARIFAPTYMNINVSVFGRMNNGLMEEDGMQGASWDEVKALREQYPNVGAVFVATDDESVIWALEQDWIDVVIPWHLGHTGQQIADFFGFTNYSGQQEDRKIRGAWSKENGDLSQVFPHMHNNDYGTYMRMLEENHLKPRFQQYLNDPRVSKQNYMKLVNETRRSAAKTPAMRPVFDMDAARDSVAKMVRDGSYLEPLRGSWEIMQAYADVMAGQLQQTEEVDLRDLRLDKAAFAERMEELQEAAEGRETVRESRRMDAGDESDIARKRKTRYNEAETKFMIWANAKSTPIGEIRQFKRYGQVRYYEKTEDGVVELSPQQFRAILEDKEYEDDYKRSKAAIHVNSNKNGLQQAGNLRYLSSGGDTGSDEQDSVRADGERLQNTLQRVTANRGADRSGSDRGDSGRGITSPYASLTVERIDYLIGDSGAGARTDYARSWITSINPSDFINLTTKDFSDRSKFDAMPNDYGTAMDDYDYMAELKRNMRQTPYLAVDLNTGEIVGHEGRHRMRALEREGITSTPVRIEFRNEDGYVVKEMNGYGNPLKTIASFTLKNQYGADNTAVIENVIPLMKATRDEVISAYGQEDADIRYSRRLESVEEKFERKVAENAALKKQLTETKKLLRNAQKELGSAAFDAWIADRETGGRVPLYEDALKVVAKYNDEALTGVSDEVLTERIVRALLAMGDKAYAPDVLVELLWQTMYDKAAAQSVTDENEYRDAIREKMKGGRFWIADQSFANLVDSVGGRRSLNEIYKDVYGFTLMPQSEAERKTQAGKASGAKTVEIGSFADAMGEVLDDYPNIFSGYSGEAQAADGDPYSMADALLELQDSMSEQEYTAKEAYGAQTLFEGAMDDAARFAEDIIRLTPVRTVADEYVARMDDLREQHRGELEQREKRITELEQDLQSERVEGILRSQDYENELAAQKKASDEKLAALRDQKNKREKELRHDVKEQAYRVNWEIGQQKLADDIYYGKKLNQKEKKIERLEATRRYYIERRHEQAVQRRDTASRKRGRDRIRTKVRWLNDRMTMPKDGAFISDNMRDGIAAFIQNFLSEETTEKGNTSVFTADQLLDLKTFYDSLNATGDGMDSFFDEDIADAIRRMADKNDSLSLRGRRLADLTKEQLNAIEDVVDNLIANVRNANKAFGYVNSMKLSGSADRLIRHVDEKKKDKGFAKMWQNFQTKKLNIDMIKPIWLFKDVIGGEMERYFTDLQRARTTWAFRVKEGQQFFAETKEKYHYKDWKKEDHTFTLSDGSVVTLTKDAVLQVYATWKRERSSITPTAHLTEGGIVLTDELQDMQKKTRKMDAATRKAVDDGNAQLIDKTAHRLTLDDIGTMLKTLTDDQKKYADAVVGYMSTTVSSWGNETSRELSGYDKFREGYYFPYQVSDLYLYHQMGVRDETRLKNAGFTKALTANATKPIVLTGFSEVAGKHVIDMANYSTLTLPLENLNRVFSYHNRDTGRSVKDALKNTFGSNVNQYISNFLNQMNGGVKRDSVGGFGMKLFSGFKRSAVAMNISVVAQQPSAVARAFYMVDPKYFVETTAQWFDWKELQQWSGTAMIKAMGSWDINTGKSTVDYILGESSKMDKFNEWTGKGAEKADAITWSHIWNAVKRETADRLGVKYSRKGMSEEFYRAAAERFDEVADYTQVYDATITRSQWMRSEDGWNKIVTQFMAEPTTSYNLLLFSGAKKEGVHGSKGAAIAALVCNVVLNTVLQSLAKAWRKKGDEPWWERYVSSFLEGIVGTKENWHLDSELFPHNLIPFVKDIFQLFQGWDVERSDMQLISDLVNSFNKLREKFAERDDDEALWEFMTANGDLINNFIISLANFGLPAKTVYRDFVLAPMSAWKRFEDAGYDLKEYFFGSDSSTTWKHISNTWKQLWEGEWDKNEQLYNAILQGDKEALARYTRVTDEDVQKYVNEANDEFAAKAHAENVKEKAYHNKVQDALKQMDSRVEDAAMALLDYDFETAERLKESIIADGFDRDDVVRAITETRDKLEPEKAYNDNEAATPYFADYDMMRRAYYDGNPENAQAVRDALHEAGKTDKQIDEEIQKSINEDFKNGEISLEEARQAYKDYTTFSDNKINEKLINQVENLYANDPNMTYDDAKQMYIDLGLSEEKAGTKVGSLVTADYENNRVESREQAVADYMKYTGETDKATASIKFDYDDLKAKDDKFPLSYDQYNTYVTKGIEAAGVSVDAYAAYTAVLSDKDANSANAAETAFTNGQKKFGIVQAQVLPYIDSMDLTSEQKDALFLSKWSSKNLPYAPWHNPGYWAGLLD